MRGIASAGNWKILNVTSGRSSALAGSAHIAQKTIRSRKTVETPLRKGVLIAATSSVDQIVVDIHFNAENRVCIKAPVYLLDVPPMPLDAAAEQSQIRYQPLGATRHPDAPADSGR